MERAVLVVAHPGRAEAQATAAAVCTRLRSAGLSVRTPEDPLEEAGGAADGCELVLVLGGDGSLLRGAELARPAGVPLLGINLGHVGFLAEAEPDDLPNLVRRVVERDYGVEDRMTLQADIRLPDGSASSTWALNDASVEKASRQRMLEVLVDVDGRPLSRWGCDGVVCATPTGSTAYAFSAGGPVVWPEVEALLMVPISAHALFARPLVVGPQSVLGVEILAPAREGAVLWCDGRRPLDLPAGSRVEVRRGNAPVRLARMRPGPFTDRLVAKFELPVSGWRGSATVRLSRRAGT